MWVALGTIYLLLITFSFFRWASREEAADRDAAAQAQTTAGDLGVSPRRSECAGHKLGRDAPILCWHCSSSCLWHHSAVRPTALRSPEREATMMYLPTQREEGSEEQEDSAAVWAFLLVLFFFKLATVCSHLLAFAYLGGRLHPRRHDVVLVSAPGYPRRGTDWCSITGYGRCEVDARRFAGRSG